MVLADAAAAKAVEALNAFNTFLKNDLSKHPADWRLGKRFYDEKFRLTLATGDTPERTLADAEATSSRCLLGSVLASPWRRRRAKCCAIPSTQAKG